MRMGEAVGVRKKAASYTRYEAAVVDESEADSLVVLLLSSNVPSHCFFEALDRIVDAEVFFALCHKDLNVDRSVIPEQDVPPCDSFSSSPRTGNELLLACSTFPVIDYVHFDRAMAFWAIEPLSRCLECLEQFDGALA